jgi:galactose mutarotase-like enzyme
LIPGNFGAYSGNKMDIKLSESFWFGQGAWLLENNAIKTIIVPSIGAKIVSLFDKRTGNEWLMGPDERPFQEVPYGASFVEQDMSGWDEMFPTIVACSYPAQGPNLGVALPDHGEVWSLPWTVEQTDKGLLSLSVEGVALRYRLMRTLTFSAEDSLHIHYTLQNHEQEPLAYIWSAHPQFVCENGAQIVLPPEVTEVCNSIPPEWGWGEPETRFSWPEATTVDGQHMQIDQVGQASREQARKFFVPPEMSVGWVGLTRKTAGDWLRLSWNPDEVPYLGLWMDEGKISSKVVAAPEPMTGYYDSLETAWEKRRVAVADPGESRSWSLSVQLGTGEQPFPTEQPA